MTAERRRRRSLGSRVRKVLRGLRWRFALGLIEAAFHVAERTFGRFARGVRLTGAFDVGRADARLRAGELRVTLPRIDERRGRERRIPVRLL